MTSNFIKTGWAGLLGLAVAGCLSASIMTTVNATSDIFSAGLGSDPGGGTVAQSACVGTECGGTAGGGFVAVAGNVLTISGVTGTVNPCPELSCASAGPDGANLGSQAPATSISGTTTLSPIQFTGDEMFLIGVFLGGTPGAPTLPGAQQLSIGQYGCAAVSAMCPAVTQTIATNAATYSPVLGQTFYIGDGINGNEFPQQFVVPTGADNLYFGFADAMFFNGTAGGFGDNTGSLAVTFQIEPAVVGGVPEPGTIVLLALGLAGLAVARKKVLA